MKLYATNSQRACAFFLDFILLETFVEVFSRIIILIIGFDTSAYNTALEGIQSELLMMLEYAELGEVYDMSFLYSAIRNFLPLYGIRFAIVGSLTFVFCVGYLVILPKLWKKQTIGRLVARVKVVRKDDKDITWGNLILREIVGTFILYSLFGGIMLFASIILCLASRRSLVDYVSGTQLLVDMPERTEEEMRQAYEQMKQYQEYRRQNSDNDDYIDATYRDLDDSDSYNPYNREDDNASNDSSSDDSDDEYKIF